MDKSDSARDQTELDGVFGCEKDDRDRRGRGLGRHRRSGAAGRDDYGHLATDQFGSQRGQSIDLILGPTEFDRDVLALDIAIILQALAKCGRQTTTRPGWPRLRCADEMSFRFSWLGEHSVPSLPASALTTGRRESGALTPRVRRAFHPVRRPGASR